MASALAPMRSVTAQVIDAGRQAMVGRTSLGAKAVHDAGDRLTDDFFLFFKLSPLGPSVDDFLAEGI